jgi:hypothetical protein
MGVAERLALTIQEYFSEDVKELVRVVTGYEPGQDYLDYVRGNIKKLGNYVRSNVAPWEREAILPQGELTADLNPKHVMESGVPSIYQGPIYETTYGEIQNSDPEVAFKLRKVVQGEKALRGPSPRFDQNVDTQLTQLTQPTSEEKFISDLVRKGTFYHGRRSYPEARLDVPALYEKEKELEGLRSSLKHLGDQVSKLVLDVKNNPGDTALASQRKYAIKLYEDQLRAVDKTRVDIANLRKKRDLGLAEQDLIMEHYGIVKRGAPTLEVARQKAYNLGEPPGSSLSVSPNVAAGFAKQDYEASEVLGVNPPKKIARVMPLFGGAPEEKLLFGWQEESGKVLQEVYREAVQDRASQTLSALKSLTHPKGNYKEDLQQAYAEGLIRVQDRDFLNSPSYHSFKPTIKDANWGEVIDPSSELYQFNQAIADKLVERGYKGILYHPKRGGYDELELKMFDPKDVLALDTRDWKGYRKDETYVGPEQDPGILKTMRWSEKPIPEKYDTPGTEIIVGPKERAIKQFTKMTKGKPVSLRDWYKKVDIKGAVEEVIKEVYGEGAELPKASVYQSQTGQAQTFPDYDLEGNIHEDYFKELDAVPETPLDAKQLAKQLQGKYKNPTTEDLAQEIFGHGYDKLNQKGEDLVNHVLFKLIYGKE